MIKRMGDFKIHKSKNKNLLNKSLQNTMFDFFFFHKLSGLILNWSGYDLNPIQFLCWLKISTITLIKLYHSKYFFLNRCLIFQAR